MTEQNAPRGGPCASPATIVLALAAALLLPPVGFHLAGLLGAGPAAAPEDEEAVLRRIQPVAQVSLAGAPAPAAATGAAPDGKKVYETTCAACHGTGAAGAPKLGDKSAWAPRLKAGLETVVTNAIKGKGAMPPKGGNMTLSDADVKAAVEYLAAAAK